MQPSSFSDSDLSAAVLVTTDHRPSIPDLGPGGLTTTTVGELGVLVVVSVLAGLATNVEPLDTPLLDAPVNHN